AIWHWSAPSIPWMGDFSTLLVVGRGPLAAPLAQPSVISRSARPAAGPAAGAVWAGRSVSRGSRFVSIRRAAGAPARGFARRPHRHRCRAAPTARRASRAAPPRARARNATGPTAGGPAAETL